MLSVILSIVITTSTPTPRDNPIMQAQTIGAFIPDYNPPPVITNSSGTR
jgi:hypothetical protein